MGIQTNISSFSQETDAGSGTQVGSIGTRQETGAGLQKDKPMAKLVTAIKTSESIQSNSWSLLINEFRCSGALNMTATMLDSSIGQVGIYCNFLNHGDVGS